MPPPDPPSMIYLESSWDFDSGDRLNFWVLGHLDPTLFLASLERQEDLTASPAAVRHEYLRRVPWLPNTGEEGMWHQFLTSPGRGATKVTIVDDHDTREIVDPMDIDGKEATDAAT